MTQHLTALVAAAYEQDIRDLTARGGGFEGMTILNPNIATTANHHFVQLREAINRSITGARFRRATR